MEHVRQTIEDLRRSVAEVEKTIAFLEQFDVALEEGRTEGVALIPADSPPSVPRGTGVGHPGLIHRETVLGEVPRGTGVGHPTRRKLPRAGANGRPKPGKAGASLKDSQLMAAIRALPEPLTTASLLGTGRFKNAKAASNWVTRAKAAGWIATRGRAEYERTKGFPPPAASPQETLDALKREAAAQPED